MTGVKAGDCTPRVVYVVQARNISGVAICARDGLDGQHVYFYGLREKFGRTFIASEHGAPEDRSGAICSPKCGGGYVTVLARLPEALSSDVAITHDSTALLDFLFALQEKYVKP